jgi:NAD(P)-dependent dehydrogenase (short-subunit alcohol dehydrogenase family)
VAVVAVCGDADVASALIAGGAHVVLCAVEAARLSRPVVALRAAAAAAGRGRVAALVGDLADPDVEAAARAMAAELFGGEPVLVRTKSDAGQLTARAPGPERARSGTV